MVCKSSGILQTTTIAQGNEIHNYFDYATLQVLTSAQ